MTALATRRELSAPPSSLWSEAAELEEPPRPPLGGDHTVDVAIVGAGYTGLWTAYYLSGLDRAMRVAVVDRDVAGFGASGRNGGWCSALFPASMARVARESSSAAAGALYRSLVDAVDEVGRVAAAEQMQIDYRKGGTLTVARTPAQLERIRAGVDHARAWALGPDDVLLLDTTAANARVRVAGCLGAAYTPHCARIHPGRLVRGLARAVERRGVHIFEHTPALRLDRRSVRHPRGVLRAQIIVRATEAYTATLPGQRRRLVPLYSLMIATEPLPAAFWAAVGWDGAETLNDARHLIIYAQRTGDDRIAFGGRGAPYHLGSRVRDRFDIEPPVFAGLERALCELFPQAREARITHRWGGPIGVPRDWFPSVGLDRDQGLAWAGGYVGDGVAASNLAGRTLADLILGRDSERVHLPWVGHRSRNWEMEPLRWLAVNAAVHAMRSADAAERRTGRTARRALLVNRLLGR